MPLIIIKAEDVRDGEPRWYCRDKAGADAAIAANAVALFVPDDDAVVEVHRAVYPLAIVDRPAPTPAPAPGLDLEALAADVGGYTGSFRISEYDGDEILEFAEADGAIHSIAMLEHDRNAVDPLVRVLNAAPALIAEVRALRARLAESTADAVAWAAKADGMRAEVARLTTEADETHQILEESVAYWERRVACAGNICAHCKEPHTDAEMSAHVAACPRSPIVSKLAEAKRLGRKAIKIISDAIDNPLDANAMASIGARQVAIAAALEAL